MKNPLVIAIILLVLGGGMFFFFKRSEQTEVQPVSTQPTNNVVGNQPAATLGRYVIYTPEALAEATQMRRVLYFYANWCPTCRPADNEFSENSSQIPEDVILFRVNYNDTETDQAEKALARQYNITYQHTFVQIDDQGEVVTIWNGGQLDELLENLR